MCTVNPQFTTVVKEFLSSCRCPNFKSFYSVKFTVSFIELQKPLIFGSVENSLIDKNFLRNKSKVIVSCENHKL